MFVNPHILAFLLGVLLLGSKRELEKKGHNNNHCKTAMVNFSDASGMYAAVSCAFCNNFSPHNSPVS